MLSLLPTPYPTAAAAAAYLPVMALAPAGAQSDLGQGIWRTWCLQPQPGHTAAVVPAALTPARGQAVGGG